MILGSFASINKKNYKSVKIGNCWCKNYIIHKNNGDRNNTLSFEKYLNKIRPYLEYINKRVLSSPWNI